jgi:hypothetical protein
VEILHAEDLAQSSNPRSDGAVSVQGNVIDLTLDESDEDLAQLKVDVMQGNAIDITLDKLDEDLAHLAADIAQPQAPPFIDNAIDQLTTDLTVFYLDHLERSVISSEDEMASTNNLEVELQVRFKSQSIDHIPMFNPFRSQNM